jgi:hypothetical protein
MPTYERALKHLTRSTQLPKGVPRNALAPGDSINSAAGLFGRSPRVCVVPRIVSFMVTFSEYAGADPERDNSKRASSFEGVPALC